ncbi:MAG: hypothetical protein WKF59_21930 [Chitinophagaceae bacterium]
MNKPTDGRAGCYDFFYISSLDFYVLFIPSTKKLNEQKRQSASGRESGTVDGEPPQEHPETELAKADAAKEEEIQSTAPVAETEQPATINPQTIKPRTEHGSTSSHITPPTARKHGKIISGSS